VNSRKTLMHDKFCLFDNKILITGSYNWTYSAEKRNSENIIITDDEIVCNAFNEHFSFLWQNLQEISDYSHINISESKEKDFVRDVDDILDEYEYMVSEKIIEEHVVNELQEHKNNIIVARLASLSISRNRKNPKLKFNIGMRCRINGVDGKVLHIIEQGQTLPFTNKVRTCTASDNQKSIICEIVYGNSEEADDNISLLKIPMDNLPIKKAGEVKFYTKVTLDTNGYMHVERVCINNGIAKEAVYKS